MLKKILAWVGGPKRLQGQSCETCRHFIDYRCEDDEPGEVNGYCAQVLDTLGWKEARNVNEYLGGYWTVHTSWCRHWEGGPKILGQRRRTIMRRCFNCERETEIKYIISVMSGELNEAEFCSVACVDEWLSALLR